MNVVHRQFPHGQRALMRIKKVHHGRTSIQYTFLGELSWVNPPQRVRPLLSLGYGNDSSNGCNGQRAIARSLNVRRPAKGGKTKRRLSAARRIVNHAQCAKGV